VDVLSQRIMIEPSDLAILKETLTVEVK
jgi:hypothetical protein